MNINNIKIVRDHLKELVKSKRTRQFNMSHLVAYIDNNKEEDSAFIAMKEGACNTSACICGWAAVLLGTKEELAKHEVYGNAIWSLGREKLGLTYGQAEELFAPWDIDFIEEKYPDERAWDVQKATPERAIKVLDHIIETGEIDWNKAFEDA